MEKKKKTQIEDINEQEVTNNPFASDDDSAKVEENQGVEANTNTSEETQPEVTDNKLQEDFDNLNNQYIRLAADFDNYRKRQAQERENLLKYGASETMKKLIEVLDNFDRGEKAVESVEDCQQVKESFNLVCKQMRETLQKLGLEIIEAEGQEFDPNFHEAVMQTPTSEHPENTVINVLQKGYKMGDKVLRPALVNVATAE